MVAIKNTLADHPTNSKLIKYGQLVRFDELSLECQNALIHYMSVDGAAWAVEDGWKDWIWGEGTPMKPSMRLAMLADIEKFRPRFIASYGNIIFGYAEIPLQELIESINYITRTVHNDPDANWVQELSDDIRVEYKKPTWPVILSSFHDEVLQDGWHRLAMYNNCKIPLVPVLWFVDGKDYPQVITGKIKIK